MKKADMEKNEPGGAQLPSDPIALDSKAAKKVNKVMSQEEAMNLAVRGLPAQLPPAAPIDLAKIHKVKADKMKESKKLRAMVTKVDFSKGIPEHLSVAIKRVRDSLEPDANMRQFRQHMALEVGLDKGYFLTDAKAGDWSVAFRDILK